MTNRQDRIRGGLWGLLIGDALGVPYEFREPHQLPPPEQIEFDPPPGFRRSHPRAPRAAWSDDGATALCLLASLLKRGQLELEDLARRFSAWWAEGYMAVDGVVFDIGGTTGEAIARFRENTPAAQCGPTHERANGNGALMRVLPLALWHEGSDEELVALAMRQSLVTHGHLRSQLCCALYCLWARGELAGDANAWERARTQLRAMAQPHADWLYELDAYIDPVEPPTPGGTGYVVDCLHSAHFACAGSTYADIVHRAIRLGHDSDTTACVAGGIAGLRHGVDGIPDRWRQEMAGREEARSLIEGLVAARG